MVNHCNFQHNRLWGFNSCDSLGACCNNNRLCVWSINLLDFRSCSIKLHLVQSRRYANFFFLSFILVTIFNSKNSLSFLNLFIDNEAFKKIVIIQDTDMKDKAGRLINSFLMYNHQRKKDMMTKDSSIYKSNSSESISKNCNERIPKLF